MKLLEQNMPELPTYTSKGPRIWGNSPSDIAEFFPSLEYILVMKFAGSFYHKIISYLVNDST